MTPRQLTATARQIIGELPITSGKSQKQMLTVAREMLRAGNEPEQVQEWLERVVLVTMAEYGE
jgi:hypothetical protein